MSRDAVASAPRRARRPSFEHARREAPARVLRIPAWTAATRAVCASPRPTSHATAGVDTAIDRPAAHRVRRVLRRLTPPLAIVGVYHSHPRGPRAVAVGPEPKRTTASGCTSSSIARAGGRRISAALRSVRGRRATPLGYDDAFVCGVIRAWKSWRALSGSPDPSIKPSLTMPRQTRRPTSCSFPCSASDALTDVHGSTVRPEAKSARARASGEFASRLYEVFVDAASVAARRKANRVASGRGRRGRGVRRASAPAWRDVRVLAAQVPARSHAAFLVRGGSSRSAAAQHIADGLSAAEFDGASYLQERTPASRCSRDASRSSAPARTLSAIAAGGRARPVICRESRNFTRGLANEPANVLTPSEFAERVSSRRRSGAGLVVEVLDEQRIAKLGMNLLLGVAQGSALPPRLIVLRHEPAGAPASPVIGLDRQGRHVRYRRRVDQAGRRHGAHEERHVRRRRRRRRDARARAAWRPFRTIGIIPLAENMVGGRAIRPGDVLRGASGKTVEVINTDAEGRLILGDALWYAQAARLHAPRRRGHAHWRLSRRARPARVAA